MSAHLDAETLACLALEESDGDAIERAHLDACAQCRARLSEDREALRAIELVRREPAPTTQELARLRARLLTSIAPRLDAWTGLAVVSAGLVVLASRAHAVALERALPSIALIVLAGVFAATASSRGARGTLAALVAASILVGAIDLATVGATLSAAVGCERFIALAAVLPFLSALYAARSAGTQLERGYTAAVGAAAGALAAQAALLTWCSHEAGLVHVLGFHVAAVLATTIIGGLAGAFVPAPRLA